jgi:hypothetical protein
VWTTPEKDNARKPEFAICSGMDMLHQFLVDMPQSILQPATEEPKHLAIRCDWLLSPHLSNIHSKAHLYVLHRFQFSEQHSNLHECKLTGLNACDTDR